VRKILKSLPFALPLLGTAINALVLALPPFLIARPAPAIDMPAMVFLILISGWCFLEMMIQPTVRPELTRCASKRWLPGAMGLVLLALFWAALVERLRQPLPVDLLNWAGIIAVVAGITLRLVSIRVLGGYFLDEIALKPGQPVIMHGIYRYQRHPSEVGLLLIALGSAAWLGSTFALLICAFALLPMSLWRTLLEDRLLLAHDPRSFRSFSDAVPGLVPRRFL
jgi:protein-S-isoprenylcysteine O-methyltransferase Ste14